MTPQAGSVLGMEVLSRNQVAVQRLLGEDSYLVLVARLRFEPWKGVQRVAGASGAVFASRSPRSGDQESKSPERATEIVAE